MKHKTLIEFDHVRKTYQTGDTEVVALNDITLTIKEGEFVIVLGPSGSGKSTMMHLLGCLDYPSKGTISLDGQDITTLSESDLARIRGKKIGFIFQSFNLIQTISAYENVALSLEFQDQHSDDDIHEKVHTVLKLVDLENRADHRPTQLSGGQMQRVAIARALVGDPDIILADEPTGNLDSKAGEIIISFLKKLNKEQKKTIIVVTHDNSLVPIGTRTIRLKDGNIIGGH